MDSRSRKTGSDGWNCLACGEFHDEENSVSKTCRDDVMYNMSSVERLHTKQSRTRLLSPVTLNGVLSGRCVGTLTGHDDEVLDVGFDFTGQYLLSASADGTGRIYNSTTHQLISKLQGHDGEISKVMLFVVLLCLNSTSGDAFSHCVSC